MTKNTETPKDETITKGYKGFDKDLKCNGMQYAIGEIAEMEAGKKLTVCPTDLEKEGGLHFCENPFHVLRYYRASAGSRYAKVDGIGEAIRHTGDSKVAVRKIKIKEEIKLKGLIAAGMTIVFDRVKKIEPNASGDFSTGAASGKFSTGAASGDYSTGAASGKFSTAKVTGDNSIAVAWGFNSKASGVKGCWLVLNEWADGKCIAVLTVAVDGIDIKENVFYNLVNGKPCIAE